MSQPRASGQSRPSEPPRPPTEVTAGPREVLSLAVPAFLALVAEPLFLLVDSAVVGRLGVTPLAGLGAASAVLTSVAGLFVFLAYGTTAAVARRMGAGQERDAAEDGWSGIWLALLIGLAAAAVTGGAARPLVEAVGGSPEVVEQASTYLRISALGLPAMLLVLAATGVLRGHLDTRTPLVVATVGFTGNAVLNVVLVHGVGLGIAGAAWGTVIAQVGMAVALVAVVARHGRRVGASVALRPSRVLASAADGVPLLVRTLALRAVLMLTVATAASFGDVPLAAHQVTSTVWSTLVFALDAIAIAAQALTGRALGAGDAPAVRRATTLMMRWGLWSGVAVGVLVALVHRVLPAAFTQDPDVRSAIAAALLVVAVSQPLAGVVFVADGVLIGAGDGRWLAVASTVTLIAYLPMLLLAREVGQGRTAPEAMVVLWIAFSGFMLVRWGTLWWRLRGDGWLVTGASR